MTKSHEGDDIKNPQTKAYLSHLDMMKRLFDQRAVKILNPNLVIVDGDIRIMKRCFGRINNEKYLKK